MLKDAANCLLRIGRVNNFQKAEGFIGVTLKKAKISLRHQAFVINVTLILT